MHTLSENEDGGRGVREGEYRSEEKNLVFEQGQECPARGGISAGEEHRASARKNGVGLKWPRSAGWAREGARHDGSSAQKVCTQKRNVVTIPAPPEESLLSAARIGWEFVGSASAADPPGAAALIRDATAATG